MIASTFKRNMKFAWRQL